ncbi:MAG: MBL fold metallo-hydrolase [Archangiaceae bacterium]|nr:MBL fold metallo-hydrolase [Archangiaceae bacterium]
MAIELECLGAAGTVTGSKHLLRTSRATVLLDCGLFQGRREEARARNEAFDLGGRAIDAVVLSHAHIDHSGALPVAWRQGYRGPIYATPATRDLCVPMLEDAAHIQLSDAKYIQLLIARGHREVRPVEPLYTREDAVAVLGQFIGLPYHRAAPIAPGVKLTFLDAGHVLGSAVCVLDIEDQGRRLRFAFTGDLGRHHLPILRDPQTPDGVECLVMESTYGDRLHEPIDRSTESLGEAIRKTLARKGKVIIPSFALERAQEIIFALKRLRAQAQLPKVPVYVDSPLAVRLTEVFKLHPECYDAETAKYLSGADSPFEFDGLHYVSEVADSMAIDSSDEPSVVIAAGGMCEGGRVLHHLRHGIGNERNTVIIVGYQAQHTLGRRLVEGRAEVRIFGVPRSRAAEVVVLNGFSAHADQAGLLRYAGQVGARGPLSRIVLVHGEPKAQAALKAQLTSTRVCAQVDVPARGDVLTL